MTDWEKLLSAAEVPNALRERKKTYLEKTTWRSALEDEQGDGWYFFKDTKDPKKVKVHKNKSVHDVFENRLWVLFASMGFYTLNRDQHFTINYSQKGQQLDKQIDVFAADDETVLVVECKCAESLNDKKQWKTELEAINGYMSAARSEIRKKFPERNIKFIFATQNYIVGDQDKKRMEEFGIAYFDEKVIKYYEELVKHLGSCSRYQLLGSLFAHTKISGMDNRIPAIRGKMGGYTYYAFSCQPETLLKIGYVLHRSEANEGLMPTYQRIIKKTRLKSVHDFIENHGFFPNSIVISIESTKEPVFELSEKQGTDDVAKCGILHLPNLYRSAYIIDGQHRLYGYSDSKYAKTNSIPVVAFVNMDQKEQVKLFMEINENQKAVSKNLRNTLNADLLWVSDKPSERREALRSRIAQELGDNNKSPLFNRVIIGEDQADDYRCITLEMLCDSLDSTDMITKFNKDQTPQMHGVFDLDDNNKSLALLEKYIFGCFAYLREFLPEEWGFEHPKKESKVLYNIAVGGMIRLFGDIAAEIKNKGYDPKKIDEFLEETHYYLDPLQGFIQSLNEEEKEELRTNYGGNGPRHYWRTMQKAIHEAHEEYLPDGFIKYWEEHGKSFNSESIDIMTATEKTIRAFVRGTLEEKYPGVKWIQQIPKKIYTDATTEASKHEYETGEKLVIWEFFSMSDLREIIIYGSNWSSYFDVAFTLPSESKIPGGKKAKTEWLEMIDKLQKNIGRANFSVAKSQYERLKEIEKEIIPKLS